MYKEAAQDAALSQISCDVVDKFHAKGHVSGCPCSPYDVPALMRRVRDVNTSICEQVFAHFRIYAKTLSDMRPNRHAFLILNCAKLHNEDACSRGDNSKLNSFSHSNYTARKRTVPYACNTAAPHQAKRP